MVQIILFASGSIMRAYHGHPYIYPIAGNVKYVKLVSRFPFGIEDWFFDGRSVMPASLFLKNCLVLTSCIA